MKLSPVDKSPISKESIFSEFKSAKVCVFCNLKSSFIWGGRKPLLNCRKNSLIGLLATEGTLKTGVYNKFFDKEYKLVSPNNFTQKNSVNKAIKLVKMGKVKEANKIIKPAIDYLIKKRCKKIILGCTELPIAIFAFKSFKSIKTSKIFLDPNLILANSAMKKYKTK